MSRLIVGFIVGMFVLVSIAHAEPKGKEGEKNKGKENSKEHGKENEKSKGGKPPGGDWSDGKPGAPHGPQPHDPPHNEQHKGGVPGHVTPESKQPQPNHAEGAAAAAANNNKKPQTTGREEAAGAAAANRNQPAASGAAGVAAGAAAANRNQPAASGAAGVAAGAAAANRNQPAASGAAGAAAGAAAANRNQPAVSGAAGAAAGAAAVRNSFDQPNLYGQQWHAGHPTAWTPAGWAPATAWHASEWKAAAGFCAFNSSPVSYNYGNNVICRDGNVLLDGQKVCTAAEFSQQAADLAQMGTAAETPADTKWLPLGVFALVRNDQQPAQLIVQIAMNRQGIVRGNYTDITNDHTLPIHGAVDPQTQRLAWTVGGNTTSVMEVGLKNLTEGEAPALLHKNGGTDRWLLVRLEQSTKNGNTASP